MKKNNIFLIGIVLFLSISIVATAQPPAPLKAVSDSTNIVDDNIVLDIQAKRILEADPTIYRALSDDERSVLNELLGGKDLIKEILPPEYTEIVDSTPDTPSTDETPAEIPDTTTNDEQTTEGKSSKMKWILLALLAIMLLGGGTLGFSKKARTWTKNHLPFRKKKQESIVKRIIKHAHTKAFLMKENAHILSALNSRENEQDPINEKASEYIKHIKEAMKKQNWKSLNEIYEQDCKDKKHIDSWAKAFEADLNHVEYHLSQRLNQIFTRMRENESKPKENAAPEGQQAGNPPEDFDSKFNRATIDVMGQFDNGTIKKLIEDIKRIHAENTKITEELRELQKIQNEDIKTVFETEEEDNSPEAFAAKVEANPDRYNDLIKGIASRIKTISELIKHIKNDIKAEEDLITMEEAFLTESTGNQDAE